MRFFVRPVNYIQQLIVVKKSFILDDVDSYIRRLNNIEVVWNN